MMPPSRFLESRISTIPSWNATSTQFPPFDLLLIFQLIGTSVSYATLISFAPYTYEKRRRQFSSAYLGEGVFGLS